MREKCIAVAAVVFSILLVHLYSITVNFVREIKPATITKFGHFANNMSELKFNTTVVSLEFKTVVPVFSPGGMGGMYNLAESFCRTVFDDIVAKIIDFVRKLVLPQFGSSKSVEAVAPPVSQLLNSLVAFLAALAFGVVIMLCTPVIGCCCCCCRNCGNCGGRPMQRYHPKESIFMYIQSLILFILILLIFGGAICSYVSLGEVIPVFREFLMTASHGLDDAGTFINGSAKQLVDVGLGTLKFGSAVIERDLKNVDSILGMAVAQKILRENSLLQIEQVITTLDEKVEFVNYSLFDLQLLVTSLTSTYGLIKADIDSLRTDLLTTCGEFKTEFQKKTLPPPECPELTKLGELNQFELPDLTMNLDFAEQLKDVDITSYLDQGLQTFFQMADTIKDAALPIITELKNITQYLDEMASNKISSNQEWLLSMISLVFLKCGAKCNKMIDTTFRVSEFKGRVNDVLGYLDKYVFYIYQVGVSLSVMQIIIISFLVLGLVLGLVAHRPATQPPTERTTVSHYGGRSLMCAVVSTCIFVPFLTFVVMVFFTVSGPITGVICPIILKHLAPLLGGEKGTFLGNMSATYTKMINATSPVELKMEKILSDCKNNTSLFYVMQLDKSSMIDISRFISPMIEQMYRPAFKDFVANIEGHTILNKDLRSSMDSYLNALDFNLPAMIEEVDVELPNFDSVVNKMEEYQKAIKTPIDAFNNVLPPNDPNRIDEGLKEKVDNLVKRMHRIKDSLPRLKESMSAILKKGRSLGELNNLKSLVNDSLNRLVALEPVLKDASVTVITTLSDAYIERLVDTAILSVDHLLTMMKDKMFLCASIYNIYDAVIVTGLCKKVTNTMNGVWISISFTLSFCLFACISAMLLSKYFYRMTELDRADPRGQLQSPTSQYSPPPPVVAGSVPMAPIAAGSLSYQPMYLPGNTRTSLQANQSCQPNPEASADTITNDIAAVTLPFQTLSSFTPVENSDPPDILPSAPLAQTSSLPKIALITLAPAKEHTDIPSPLPLAQTASPGPETDVDDPEQALTSVPEPFTAPLVDNTRPESYTPPTEASCVPNDEPRKTFISSNADKLSTSAQESISPVPEQPLTTEI